MHIPDGYLSPATCVTLTGIMLPVWYRACIILKKNLDVSRAPFMAMAAVFAFLVMMFNVPIPGGTTAHATGAVLIAIVLGPWTAVLAMSIALFIQAVLFGDGGILAFGANAFNMAFLMPFTGYYLFKAISRNSAAGSLRQLVSAAIAGYVAINAAALAAGFEFGLQPLLFHTAEGLPLYCPYGLEIALPAMAVSHLTVGGFVEGIVTALALKFIMVHSPELIAGNSSYGCKGA